MQDYMIRKQSFGSKKRETNLNDLERGVRRCVVLEDAIVKEGDAVVGLLVAVVVRVWVGSHGCVW